MPVSVGCSPADIGAFPFPWIYIADEIFVHWVNQKLAADCTNYYKSSALKYQG